MKRTVICMLLLLAVTTVKAYDFKVDGICYNVLSVPNRTVEVTYTYPGYLHWTDKEPSDYTGAMVIPETVQFSGRTFTVTSIGMYAFKYSTISSIQIPRTVKLIDQEAFAYCKMESFIVPKTVVVALSMPPAKKIIIEDSSNPLYLYIERDGNVNYYDDWGNKAETYYVGRTVKAGRTQSGDYFPFLKATTVTLGKLVSAKCIYNSIEEGLQFNTTATVVLEQDIPPVINKEFEKDRYLKIKLRVPATALSRYQSANIWQNFFNIEGY